MSERTTDEAKENAQEHLPRVESGLYKHYKGGLYIVYGTSVKEDTLDVLVHYYSLEKQTRWTRTLTDFSAWIMTSGKTLPAGAMVCPSDTPRFTRVRSASLTELLTAVGMSELAHNLQILLAGQRFVQSLLKD